MLSEQGVAGLLLNTPQDVRVAELANEVQRLLERVRQVRKDGGVEGRNLALVIGDLERARDRLTMWAILGPDY